MKLNHSPEKVRENHQETFLTVSYAGRKKEQMKMRKLKLFLKKIYFKGISIGKVFVTSADSMNI